MKKFAVLRNNWSSIVMLLVYFYLIFNNHYKIVAIIIITTLWIYARDFRALHNLVEFYSEKKDIASNDQELAFPSEIVPTIFIGGLDGSDIKIQDLINSLENVDNQIQYTGEILVNDTGKINWNVDYIKVTNPLIHLKFSQKHANMFFYDIWLKNSIKQISQRYSTDCINLVGYSLGGVVATRYICNTYTNKDKYPKVNKLVTLGSPILGSYVAFFKFFYSGARDIIPHSIAIRNFKDYYVKNFDPDTKVLSVAGGLFDGAVTQYSAHGLKLVRSSKNIEIMNTKKITYHGNITIKSEVRDEISKFLY